MADRAVAFVAADIASAASAASAPSERPCDTDSSDARWDAQPPCSLAGSGCSWHSQPQYEDISAASRREECRSVRRGHASTHGTPVRSPHLHDIPLLI